MSKAQHILKFVNESIIFQQGHLESKDIADVLEGHENITQFRMLMYVQKLKMWNKFGRKGRRKQIEFLTSRINLRVRSSIKMVKGGRKSNNIGAIVIFSMSVINCKFWILSCKEIAALLFMYHYYHTNVINFFVLFDAGGDIWTLSKFDILLTRIKYSRWIKH